MKFPSLLLLSPLAFAAHVQAQNAVTFRVDMSVQEGQGAFKTTQTVEVRGAFNGWSAGSLLADADGDKIYQGVFDLGDNLVGTTVEYKFAFDNGGVTKYEDAIPNRRYVMKAGAQTVEKAFFDNDGEIDGEIKAEVIFQVDLNVQIVTGKFNPATDQVWVRGSRMGWSEPPSGVEMKEDAKRPGVYTVAYQPDPYNAGDVIKYKYTLWKPDSAATVWEGGADKDASVKGSDPDTDGDGFKEGVIPLTYFNNITFAGVLSKDTNVVFRVDMSQAKVSDAPFDPAAEGVWINGPFPVWYGWGSQPDEQKMYDDGKTAGDEKAGDLIYSWSTVFKKGDARFVEYKYGVDSGDNEAAFNDNHIRYINTDGKYLMPVDTFSNMVKEPKANLTTGEPATLPILAIAKTAKGIGLSWPATDGVAFDIERSDSLQSGSWKVIGTDVKANGGAVSYEDTDSAVAKSFYRAKAK